LAPFHYFQAIQTRHLDVEEHQVHLALLELDERLSSTPTATNYLNITDRRQYGFHVIECQWLVIDD
jgi:hypothetical protein